MLIAQSAQPAPLSVVPVLLVGEGVATEEVAVAVPVSVDVEVNVEAPVFART